MEFFNKYFYVIISIAFITTESRDVYDLHNGICCDGVVYTFESEQSRPFCCGKEIIDFEASLCCNGTVQPKPNDDWICCGHQSIEKNKTVCSSVNVPVAIPKEAIVDHNSICAKSPDDYETYSESEKICCAGALTDKIGKMACCGETAYDEEHSICCQQTKTHSVVNLPKDRKNLLCCGDTYYNMSSQVCCDGTPVDKLNTTGSLILCCGKQPYDFKTSICCGNQIFGYGNLTQWRCCGSKPYDLLNQVCCGGTELKDLDTPGEVGVCCGEEIIPLGDMKTKRCVNDVIYNVDADHDICVNWFNNESTTLYNLNEQVCCVDGPMNIDAIDIDENCNTTRPSRECCHTHEEVMHLVEILHKKFNLSGFD